MIYDDFPDLYDAQYLAYRDDLPFYLRLAADNGDSVLELGAGSGRITEALARAGHKVVGLDASAAMLARARERLTAAAVAGRVELLHGDMRDFELGRRFPLIIAPFNTLMHAYSLEDQDRTLACVHRHLEPSGVFAFDLYVPRFGPLGVLRSEPTLPGGAPATATHEGHTDLFLVQHDDPDRQLLTTTYYRDQVGPDGSVKRSLTTLRQRYYTRFEIERALRSASFTLTLYGGFDRSRLDQASHHLVGVARPAKAAL